MEGRFVLRGKVVGGGNLYWGCCTGEGRDLYWDEFVLGEKEYVTVHPIARHGRR